MFRTSRFQQLIQALPRGSFDKLVAKHQSDKHSKGFSSWDHLVAMVYAQLAGANSLRQLEAGFNSAAMHHYHLGCDKVRRSTLSQANSKRAPAVFADTVKLLMGQVQGHVKRECEQMLYLLDSTSITLKGPGFDDWTAQTATRNTQGMKLHVLLDGDRYAPSTVSMTAANVNDIDEGRSMPIERDAIYVFDKGYCDYGWWHQIAQSGATFVTRFKMNASVVVERHQPIPVEDRHLVLVDEIVRFKNKYPGGKRRNPYTDALRRITIHRADHNQPLVLATNDLVSPAREIAQRYKERWGIELFFKWIKQHLNIKRFLGRSENAVRTQILTALLAYLMLILYKQLHGLKGSLWETLGKLRVTLFIRPDTEVEIDRRRREKVRNFTSRQPGLF